MSNNIKTIKSISQQSLVIGLRSLITFLVFLSFLITFTTAQSLQSYISLAEKNNPILEYHKMSYDIGMSKVDEVGNLPDTKFMAGYYLFAPETRVGPQRIKLGAQQSFPWPGTLKAQKDKARSQAKINAYDKTLETINLRYQVKQLYYKLYANSAKLNVLKENKEILAIYENMALASLENNNAKMSDVFKIRVQKNELHSRIYSNINDKIAWSKQFNRLLNRDEDVVVSITDSLSVLDIVLLDHKVEDHPIFKKLDTRTEAKKAVKKLITFERKPKFTAAIDYISVSKRQDVEVAHNGKDIFMPRVGIAVPIFNKKYDAKTNRINLEVEQIEIQKHNQLQALKNELDGAKTKLDNAILKVVAAEKNKDQIQKAIDADLKAYETGKLDYDSILRMQLEKIKYEIMEIEATKEAYLQEARMMWIVGS